MRSSTFFTVFCFFSIISFGQDVIVVKPRNASKVTGKQVEILVDTLGKKTADDIRNASDFKEYSKGIQTFLLPENNVWLRFAVKNNTAENKIYFTIDYSNISEIFFYM